jgi:hypothetical protein
VFKQEKTLIKHLKLHKNNEISAKRFFECDFCKKKFNSKYEFSVHEKVHLKTQDNESYNQDELTSERIIKSEHECSDVEETQDDENYINGK